jgi:type I restriction enzyme M protein
MIVPDNVLFEENIGRRLRIWVMELCNLHTILRLPTGIFYSQGVKTNALFFTRGMTERDNTQAVWVYDLRSNMPAFGKTRLLAEEDFKEFEAAYGEDSSGNSKREDTGEEGRFRRFTRADIAARNDSLEIVWLRGDEVTTEDQLTDAEDIAAAIIGHLKAALAEVEAVGEEIGRGNEELTGDDV